MSAFRRGQVEYSNQGGGRYDEENESVHRYSSKRYTMVGLELLIKTLSVFTYLNSVKCQRKKLQRKERKKQIKDLVSRSICLKK